MKPKHIAIRVEQCLALAKASNCPRRKFGALLVDPERNVILMDGYNGGPRGGGELCHGGYCVRERQRIISGTRIELGCHHAEMNVICNVAATPGVSAKGAWLFVTGEPCLMCAKLIHHAGITRVLCVEGGYAGGGEGVRYLQNHGVHVEPVAGPPDPRSAVDIRAAGLKDPTPEAVKEMAAQGAEERWKVGQDGDGMGSCPTCGAEPGQQCSDANGEEHGITIHVARGD